MNTSRIAAILWGLCLLAGPSLDAAGAEGSVLLRTVAETELETVNEQGTKEIVRKEASRVTPGDEVIYTVFYENTGPAPAENVFITNPVPEHMVCVAVESVSSAEVALSVDGGRTFGAAEALVVTEEDGSERPAELGDATHVRWGFGTPLPPGASGRVSFRAVLR